jgi:cytochrome c oxidase assembly protein subunit 15
MEVRGVDSPEDLHAEVARGAGDAPAGPWLPRLTKALAVGTLFLVLLGANVTSTESGMADEHWPTFEGKILPSWRAMAEDSGKLYEHTHRIFAGCVILFTWALAITLKFSRRETRAWVRRLAWGSALVILLPALLGGLTVLYNTPPELSVLHVGLAMLVLGLNTALAVATGRQWPPAGSPAPASQDERPEPIGPEETGWLLRGALFCLGSVYLQILLGAILRHAAYGEMLHIMWAFMVFTIVMVVVSRVFGQHAKRRALFRPCVLLMFLLVAQFFLGLIAYVTKPEGVDAVGSDLHQIIATLHQVLGALMLMASVVFLLRVLRLRYLEARPSAPAMEGERV